MPGTNAGRGRRDVVQVGLLWAAGVPYAELAALFGNVLTELGRCVLRAGEF